MKREIKLIACILATVAMTFAGCGTKNVKENTYKEAKHIVLNENSATLDNKAVKEYDYSWHIDPDSEEPWYEGTEPSGEDAVYIAHDIIYYPKLNESGFSKEKYDGEEEWVFHYTKEGLTDYIFATLPAFKGSDSLPTEMMHSETEAYNNPVLYICEPGTYILEGTWLGQIQVNLSSDSDAYTDPEAKVTIILNGVDVTCDCGPAFLCTSAYECDNTASERTTPTNLVDTLNAGVNVVIADGTENNFTGANVYRLLKAQYKKEGSTVQKKLYKYDGAFYSTVSMNINGEDAGTGILNITSTTFEGLDTEMHLSINGGYINIYSQDDGINVNEDDTSVFSMNGGVLHIFAGLGAEGDCVDSNGFIVVNGGTIAAGTPSGSDQVLDSNNGLTENGGQVIVIGAGAKSEGEFGFGMKGGPGRGFGEDRELPEGFEFPEGFDMPEGMEPPEGFERPNLPSEHN